MELYLLTKPIWRQKDPCIHVGLVIMLFLLTEMENLMKQSLHSKWTPIGLYK